VSHILERLAQAGVAHPPKWLIPNTVYLTLMGSHAYGCQTDESDLDVYGFAVPLKEDVFPHLAGHIQGFGRQIKRFDQYQESHLADETGREVDITIYGIVRWFQLVMEANPNMVDSLFTHRTCVLHSTAIAEMVRGRRKLFLSKKLWHTCRGYSYAQLQKMSSKTPQPGSKRAASVEQHGYDVKYAVHLVRLILQLEQALQEGDIDLMRDREMLKDIRRGNWTEKQVRDWFSAREPLLEKLYHESTAVPYAPDEDAIKTLLLECLEHHYGSLQNCVVSEHKAVQALREIRAVTERVL
jgi:predicted nucleotidyltransferase